MTYDAGTIDATLTVDRDPFQRGLDQARLEGERFEARSFRSVLAVDLQSMAAEASLAQLQTMADRLDGRAVQLNVRLRQPSAAAVARLEALTTTLERLQRTERERNISVVARVPSNAQLARLAALPALLDALNNRVVVITVDIRGNVQALLALSRLNRELDRLDGRAVSAALSLGLLTRPLSFLNSGLTGTAVKMLAVTAAAGAATVAVGALGGALTVAAVGGAAALGGALGAVVGTLGIFALAAVPAIKGVTAAQKELTAAQEAYDTATTDEQRAAALERQRVALAGLSDEQRGFLTELQATKDAYADFSRTAQGPTLAALTPFLRGATAALAEMAPAVVGVSAAVGNVGLAFEQLVNGEAFSRFTDYLGGDGARQFEQFGSGLFVGLGGVLDLLVNITPLTDRFADGFARAAGNFAEFAANGGGSGFAQFANQILPQVASTIGAIGQALGALGSATTGAISPVLGIITTLAEVLESIFESTGFQVFAAGLSTALDLLQPGLVALGEAFSVVLDAIGPVLPVLADVAAVLGQALAQAIAAVAPAVGPLATAFAAVAGALTPILPLLGELAATLLVGLAPVLETVATAFAPVIAALVNALRPVLPVLAAAFVDLTNALAPVIDQLAGLFIDALNQLAPLLPDIVTGLADMVVAIVPLLPLLVEAAVTLLPLFVGGVQAMINAMPLAVIAIESLVSIIGTIAPGIGNAVGFVLDGARLIVTTFLTMADGVISAVAGLFGWVPGIGDKLQEANRAFDTLKNGIITSLDSTAQAAYGFGESTGSEYAGGLGGQAPAAYAAGQQNAGAALLGLTEDPRLAEVGRVYGELLAAGLSSQAAALAQEAIALRTGVETGLIPTALVEANAQLLVDKYSGTLAAGAPAAAGATQGGLVDPSLAALYGAGAPAAAAGAGLGNSFSRSIAGTEAAARAAGGGLASAAAAGAAGGSLFGAGAAAGQGFVNGLGSMVGAAAAQARRLAEAAASAIGAALEIRSPSRVTMQLGHFTGEGFATGMAQTADLIARTGADLASAATGGLDRPASGLSITRSAAAAGSAAAAETAASARAGATAVPQVNFNGPMYAYDPDDLLAAAEQKQRDALALIGAGAP